ncbi:hypothetical protein, unlikely [Trypanosoma brucei gambiense DAL972]|uniref:Uncharacterized protein n=1 Tax=Trypanosoma brucei gambiense (strain MHOM/CI/86/DAL972) TaxID=679716 RepID=C9ZY99_TRYB9|nr:hypothetical protein, unlikely [Trypanosoma brucei gambiense DAL972]CBH14398.1 hypothetical protein, unlikely [Trypanosoma brucei gambiense DAL972]|eukprot:XP_011776664.1 hypothetical protein, unlikely [Trypanosoma brucei gambiense DAL972]
MIVNSHVNTNPRFNPPSESSPNSDALPLFYVLIPATRICLNFCRDPYDGKKSADSPVSVTNSSEIQTLAPPNWRKGKQSVRIESEGRIINKRTITNTKGRGCYGCNKS